MIDRWLADDRLKQEARRIAPFLILALAALLLAALVVIPRAYAARYAGKIFPGVMAEGVALGDLDASRAERRVIEALPIYEGRVVLRDPVDGRRWEREASEIGLGIGAEAERSLDPKLVVEAAMRAGRNPEIGSLRRFAEQMRIRREGLEIAPPIGLDEGRARVALESIATLLLVPPTNARLEREGDDLRDVPSSTGRVLDLDATLDAMRLLARSPITNTLDVVTQPVAARVRDLSNVSDAFNLITGSDLIMRWREGQAYTVEAETLRAWTSLEDIQSESGDTLPAIVIDRDAIRSWLQPLAASINHGERDALFHKYTP